MTGWDCGTDLMPSLQQIVLQSLVPQRLLQLKKMLVLLPSSPQMTPVSFVYLLWFWQWLNLFFLANKKQDLGALYYVTGDRQPIRQLCRWFRCGQTSLHKRHIAYWHHFCIFCKNSIQKKKSLKCCIRASVIILTIYSSNHYHFL